MATATVEVQGLLTAECGLGVEKRLMRMAGVRRASVNPASGTATVEYDERTVKLEAIKAAVRDCGYGCSGRQLPHHVCKPDDDPPPAMAAHGAHAAHAGHAPAQAAKAGGGGEGYLGGQVGVLDAALLLQDC